MLALGTCYMLVHDARNVSRRVSDVTPVVGLLAAHCWELGAPMSSSHVACLLALSGAAHGLRLVDFE